MANLLPIRHAQGEFFIADIFDGLPFKDDMASMGYPFFSLSKKIDLRTIEYKKDGVHITITPSIKGLPTIFDKDVLLYCGSLLMSEFKRLEAIGGGLPPKTLRVSTNDLLIATNRYICGDSYDLTEKSLDRLHGVSIKTNIKTNDIEQTQAFHLIESYEFIKSHYVKDRRVALEITLSDWFYNSVIGKEVLTISRDYFRLGKSLERRLYELVRKHCGHQSEWRIAMQTLHEKSGSTGRLALFRSYVKAIAEDNHLPDYTLEIIEGDNVLFKNRKSEYLPLFDNPQDLPLISPETIKKGAILVQKSGTGWDYQELCNQFNQEILNGFRPKRINGAFLNFIKKKIRQCPN
jgi:plasmid replication initiation protein